MCDRFWCDFVLLIPCTLQQNIYDVIVVVAVCTSVSTTHSTVTQCMRENMEQKHTETYFCRISIIFFSTCVLSCSAQFSSIFPWMFIPIRWFLGNSCNGTLGTYENVCNTLYIYTYIYIYIFVVVSWWWPVARGRHGRRCILHTVPCRMCVQRIQSCSSYVCTTTLNLALGQNQIASVLLAWISTTKKCLHIIYTHIYISYRT